MDAIRQRGAEGLVFEQAGGAPVFGQEEQAEVRAAIQDPPGKSEIGLASGTWKALRAFIQQAGACGTVAVPV